jgi:hypothetical protein
MTDINRKIDLMARLGAYLVSSEEEWTAIKQQATLKNPWFTGEFIALAIAQIEKEMLQPEKLKLWLQHYPIATRAKKVGIVMAGNIPLVGFHDLLCSFLIGHISYVKLSSKDDVLMRHIIEKLWAWEKETQQAIIIAERISGCDAYIATGSNNTSRYFEEYFGKYPHIIRKNRTSVAVLDGQESNEELNLLANDIFQYFGMGCRNVSQLYVPENYDFPRLFRAFEKYKELIHHNKYKNNFDYNLALLLLNKVHYLSDNVILLTQSDSAFSPLSVLNYQYYTEKETLIENLKANTEIQCIVGRGQIPYGSAQCPGLRDYADGVDTMQFLSQL